MARNQLRRLVLWAVVMATRLLMNRKRNEKRRASANGSTKSMPMSYVYDYFSSFSLVAFGNEFGSTKHRRIDQSATIYICFTKFESRVRLASRVHRRFRPHAYIDSYRSRSQVNVNQVSNINISAGENVDDVERSATALNRQSTSRKWVCCTPPPPLPVVIPFSNHAKLKTLKKYEAIRPWTFGMFNKSIKVFSSCFFYR